MPSFRRAGAPHPAGGRRHVGQKALVVHLDRPGQTRPCGWPDPNAARRGLLVRRACVHAVQDSCPGLSDVVAVTRRAGSRSTVADDPPDNSAIARSPTTCAYPRKSVPAVTLTFGARSSRTSRVAPLRCTTPGFPRRWVHIESAVRPSRSHKTLPPRRRGNRAPQGGTQITCGGYWSQGNTPYFQQLATSSELIFEGQVIRSESRWNSDQSWIHTYG